MPRTQGVMDMRFGLARAFQKTVRVLICPCILLALVAGSGCKGLPTLEQQELLVRGNNLVLDHITTRAVVNVWGKPPHHHSEFTHFFVMPDRTLIPSSRVPAGEVPKGWNAGVHAGEGVFFAYPDRGWLLVFLDEQLIYKEELKAEQLDALVKAWAYEDRFRTRLDGVPTP
ncbi:MAG: hypothetical protein HY038_00800 [Nitrospirae bacterium]|nr:hypothetical protein [Nitrospirota bacterium]